MDERSRLDQEENDIENDRFYSVARVKEIFESQANAPVPELPKRIVSRLSRGFDSFSGLLTPMFGIIILFGAFLSVVAGVVYGTLVLVVLLGSIFGLLVLFVERKVGPSLRFGEYSISRALVAQLVGVMIGLLFFLLLFAFPRFL